jgi:AcrR family transcriptional regulator
MAEMTSRQLIRRAKVIEEVIDLIADVGAEAVQMRDVAQRSGVALATVYRYFSSKDHLLAAALEDWQKRLTKRIVANAGPAEEDSLPVILEYLRRALRAFHRNPEMTALMFTMMHSADPEAQVTLDHMNRNNTDMFDRLLGGIPAEQVPLVSFGLNAALSSALTGMLTGRMTLDEALDRVAWMARVLVRGAAELPAP